MYIYPRPGFADPLEQSYCKSGHQKINSISVDLTDAKASENALQSAADAVGEGRVPDMVFCTAGAAASALGLVVDGLTHENYEWAMKTNYFTALYTTLVAMFVFSHLSWLTPGRLLVRCQTNGRPKSTRQDCARQLCSWHGQFCRILRIFTLESSPAR